jgi:proline iminopeptidase
MEQQRNQEEGRVKVKGGRIWYKRIGIDKKNLPPLVVLHGGPGYPHDYLEPLTDLSNEREVIFYDQLGCGNSDRPAERSLWTVERFVDELKLLTKALHLRRYHLLGHSWGPALAVSFALTRPAGLSSMILSDPYLSSQVWQKDADRLVLELPKKMQKAIQLYEKKGTNVGEYKEASSEFYNRFVNRMDSLPEPFKWARIKMNADIYNYMWGPKEYLVTGTLKKFDLTKKLGKVKVPVLLLSGRYDEATPEATRHFTSLFPKAQMKIFEQSAHFPFWNERDDYIKTVSRFLRGVEKEKKAR